MDFLRSLITLAAFASFLAVVWWAYAPSRKDAWQGKASLEDDHD
jgi:cbb3-type cytochrome oxidase subunit 3